MFCKLVLPSNEVHKLCYLPDNYENLHETILKKFSNQIPKNFLLKYQDSDNEYITISNTEDLKTAIFSLEAEKQKTLRIYILPPPEPSSNSKQNIKFDPLPKIPEAVEKSVSSLNELSLTSPIANSSSKQPKIDLSSSYTKFDLDNIPRTQSVILDDDASPFNFTPCPDKPGDGLRDKKFFTFTGTSSMESANSQYSKNLLNSFLNDQKVKAIEDLIESKINQTLQDKLQGIIHDLALKYHEECNNLSNLVSPANRASPYQCGTFPRMNRTSARRHTMQAPKGYTYKGPMCAGCTKIITGIKYFCLTCPDYACCEECEETQNHAHPLLKIRPANAKKNEEVEENLLELMQMHSRTPDIGAQTFGGRTPGRHSTVNPALMTMNSAINLPDICDHFDSFNTTPTASMSPMAGSAICARRGFSMGTAGMVSKLGRNCEVDNRYKASISKLTQCETMNIKPGAAQDVKLLIKNTGDSQWQDSVKLICINGIYKENEVSVPSLLPGEETTVVLPLIAPGHNARYLSQWKLHHFEGGSPKQFGKAIFVDIEVNDKERHFEEVPLEEAEENEEKEEKEEYHGGRGKENVMRQERVVKTGDNGQEPDKKLMKEMQCGEEVLNKAKTLNDMFPGDIKEKIEFIKEFPINRNINDIVSSYLTKIGRGNRKRLTWSNSMSISTQS